jgi:hypothetical protein
MRSCVQRSHYPETFNPRIDSEALVGQVGNLRPIGNRPVSVERTPSSSRVSGPRDAPEGSSFARVNAACAYAATEKDRVPELTLRARLCAPCRSFARFPVGEIYGLDATVHLGGRHALNAFLR